VGKEDPNEEKPPRLTALKEKARVGEEELDHAISPSKAESRKGMFFSRERGKGGSRTNSWRKRGLGASRYLQHQKLRRIRWDRMRKRIEGKPQVDLKQRCILLRPPLSRAPGKVTSPPNGRKKGKGK